MWKEFLMLYFIMVLVEKWCLFWERFVFGELLWFFGVFNLFSVCLIE